MPSHSDNVFLIKDQDLESLPTRPFREGLFGEKLEGALQALVEKHPQVLPGKQMEPNSDDPPRFVLLRREAPVGGWSLDHLMVDQRGVLTLIEAKLTQNPESRREVIGQIAEYAANAKATWANGAARIAADEFWSKRGQKIDDMLHQEFGDDLDPDAFWDQVDENLRKGRMRLIIVGDEIRPEVRRIIEFLNQEMANVEVYGLELRCFGKSNGQIVLVPTLIGQTQATADRKTQRDAARTWPPAALREAYAGIGDGVGKRLIEVLDWAVKNGYFMSAKGQTPVFGLRGSKEVRIFSFYYNGKVYTQFSPEKYEGGIEDRKRLVQKLNALSVFDYDPNDTASGRESGGRLTDLDDAGLKQFFEVCAEFCQRG